MTGAVLLLGAVEQREPAIAVAQRAQRRPHALDRGGQAGGGLGLRGLQQRADFGEVLQGGKQRGGAALGVAAVRQHLPGDLLRQEAQRAGEEAAVLRQRDRGGDQPLERGQRATVQLLGRERRRQRAGVGDQAPHQLLAEPVVGGGEKEVVMAEPGGDAGAGDVGRDGRSGRWRGSPSSRRPERARAAAPRRCPGRADRAAR